MNPLRSAGAIVALAFALAALAQEPQRVPKVGLIWNSVPQAGLDAGMTAHGGPAAIDRGLRERGWIPGHNIHVLSRSAESRYERLPEIVDALMRARVDVFVVFGPEAFRAVRDRTAATPIVWAGSYVLPAGSHRQDNVTGFTYATGDGPAKRIQLLKEMAPRISRVAMFARVAPGEKPPALPAQFVTKAKQLGLSVFPVYFSWPDELKDRIGEARQRGADAAYMSVFPELTWSAELRTTVHQHMMTHRLPAIYELPSMARTGGLIGFGPDDLEGARRAAYFIDRILRGVKAADLPVEQVTALHLGINRRTARELGLELPASLLIQADLLVD